MSTGIYVGLSVFAARSAGELRVISGTAPAMELSPGASAMTVRALDRPVRVSVRRADDGEVASTAQETP